jgi:hypothetical protein
VHGHSISVKHIKFAVCLSNPGGSVNTVAGNFYGIGAGSSGTGDTYDITKTGTRPMDYAGWDIYYPRTENSKDKSGNYLGPIKQSDEISFSAKYAQLRTWTAAKMPTNTLDIIPEYACRMPTEPAGTGSGPDPTFPATWHTAMIAYLEAHKVNTNHSVRYMCQFAAGSVLSDLQSKGGADNSIIPDQTTRKDGWQVEGVSLRPNFTAFHDALISLGNPSLPSGGAVGVTPTGVAVATPAAGATSTTLSWTTNGANVTYDVYKDGTLTQPDLTGSSTTVSASPGSLPQTHTYAVGGVGTDGIHGAHTSGTVSVTYTVSGVTPPSTPSAPTIPAASVGQSTATGNVTPVATATGYDWYLDGNTGTPDFTTTNPTVAMTGLSSGAHTLKVRAFNAGGPSAQSAASSSFTMTTGPDTTGPSVPTGLAAIPSAVQVNLSWTASTDTVVSGSSTSGMGTYNVQRSLSPVVGTGTTISPSVGISTTTFVDSSPPASTLGPVTVYYTVQAVDAAGNPSAYSTPLPVVIPQSTAGDKPIAVLTLPTSPVQFLEQWTADGSGSTPGTGGSITNYQFTFSDGLTIGPGSSPTARRSVPDPGNGTPLDMTVTLSVTDSGGFTSLPVSGVVHVVPADGGIFDYTEKPRYVKGAPMTAAGFNLVTDAHEAVFQTFDDRIGATEGAISQIGDPLTSRRHGGAVYSSINPETATVAFNLQAATLYVIRCTTLSGVPFSTVNWAQSQSSVSTVTNAFWAVYDVTGALMSPTGALTDVSSMWMASGEQTFTLDGAPFDPPLGADDSDDVSAITNEFFLAFYLATVGSTHPQIASGSIFAAVNLGTSLTAITPTQANIQTVPLFATSAATVGTALNAPASLGALTRSNASHGIVLL